LFCAEFSLFHFFYVLKLNFCLLLNRTIFGGAYNTPLPNINVFSTNTLLCVGEEATLTADGGSTYTFSLSGAGASISVSPIITTTYIVTGTDASGCVNTANIVQNVDECTGIVSNSGVKVPSSGVKVPSSGVEMYPNPTNGIVNLELNSDSEIIILNAIGQIVYASKLSLGTRQINLEHLAKGVYVIRIGNTVNAKNFKVIKE